MLVLFSYDAAHGVILLLNSCKRTCNNRGYLEAWLPFLLQFSYKYHGYIMVNVLLIVISGFF